MTQDAPHSAESERAVLGAILLDTSPDNSVCRQAVVLLTPDDFFLDSHRIIFRRIQELLNHGKPVDVVLLAEELGDHNELDRVGGVSCLSHLSDGLPRLSNIEHYAKIILEKGDLRRVIHAAEKTISEAQGGPENVPKFLLAARQAFPLSSNGSRGPAPLLALGLDELLAKDIKPRMMLLDPILPEQGLIMIYARRGDGKTYFAMGIAVAVSSGGTFLPWKAPTPRRVLYVDGELPAKTLQERAAMIVAGSDAEPAPGNLRFITPDLQEIPMPDLATIEGQDALEPHLENIDLLVLDNLSALCRYGRENEGEGWLPVQEWALTLRRRGISVLFVHHAGKSGTQRGTSRREDLLDTVITLKRPANYSANQGLRVEVHFEKTRAMFGDAAKPFEVNLETGPGGAALWAMRPLEDVKKEQARELFEAGWKVREVADELSVSRTTAGRMRLEWDKDRDKGNSVPASRPLGAGTAGQNANGGERAASQQP